MINQAGDQLNRTKAPDYHRIYQSEKQDANHHYNEDKTRAAPRMISFKWLSIFDRQIVPAFKSKNDLVFSPVVLKQPLNIFHK